MTQAQISFRSRLKKLAKVVKHARLAKLLRVKRSLLRNWLYRDVPFPETVSKLRERMDNKYAELVKSGAIRNGK
jgi:hypothetical protein